MCKLLELRGHPHKFIECKKKCFTSTSKEYVTAGLLLWFGVISLAIVGLLLLP